MLSNFLITLFSFIGDVIDCNLHFSNGGNCLTTLPENVDTIAGAKAFVNTKLEALRTSLALPATTGSTKGLDPRYDIGLNTALSTPLSPNLALVFTNGARPYLYPSCKPLPTRGKPPPISAPSYPYFILFLNDAAALSLPVKPFVDSGSKNKDLLPGSDAIKSVAPTTAIPSIALAAILLIFLVLVPFILFIRLLI